MAGQGQQGGQGGAAIGLGQGAIPPLPDRLVLQGHPGGIADEAIGMSQVGPEGRKGRGGLLPVKGFEVTTQPPQP